jgi:hypothetical protein
MGDMMVDGPTHETVEVFGQSPVAIRDEDFAAFTALMHSSPTVGYLALDTTGGEHQIECLFMPGRIPSDPLSFVPQGQLRATTRRTLLVREYDTLIDSHFAVQQSLGLASTLLCDLFGADIHMLPLVIEMGALINVLEVRMEELFLAPCIHGPELIDFLH